MELGNTGSPMSFKIPEDISGSLKFAPGALDHMIGKNVPLKWGVNGPVIGKAWMNEDGTFSMEFNPEEKFE